MGLRGWAPSIRQPGTQPDGPVHGHSLLLGRDEQQQKQLLWIHLYKCARMLMHGTSQCVTVQLLKNDKYEKAQPC